MSEEKEERWNIRDFDMNKYTTNSALLLLSVEIEGIINLLESHGKDLTINQVKSLLRDALDSSDEVLDTWNR